MTTKAKYRKGAKIVARINNHWFQCRVSEDNGETICVALGGGDRRDVQRDFVEPRPVSK